MKTILAAFITAVSLSGLAAAQTASAASDLLVVVHDGLYGYIDHNGTQIIPSQFLWASDFENGYGTVYVCGRYAFIASSGKLTSIETSRGGSELRPKRVNSKFGFVDGAGNLKIAPVFDDAMPFSDGVAAVDVNDKWGFIDTNGQFKILPQFDAAYYFREGVGYVMEGDTPLLIDTSGKTIARGYEVLSGVVNEGRIPVSRGDKYGYLELTGSVAIPLTLDGASTFAEGLAAVKKGEKWGYIDKNGSMVIPFKFDSAGDFGNGLALAKLGNESGFIARSGQFAFRLAFEVAPGFWGLRGSTDVSRFWTKTGAFGYVTTSGKVIWGPVPESPDHTPLFGWTDEDKRTSCDVVSESIREAAIKLPVP